MASTIPYQIGYINVGKASTLFSSTTVIIGGMKLNFVLCRGVASSQGLNCTRLVQFGTQQSGLYGGVSSRQGWPL